MNHRRFEPTELIAKQMAAAIIEQAIIDYKLLFKRGIVTDCRIRPGATLDFKTRVGGTGAYEHICQAEDLCNFLRPGGAMEDWITTAELEVTPYFIRQQLKKFKAAA